MNMPVGSVPLKVISLTGDNDEHLRDFNNGTEYFTSQLRSTWETHNSKYIGRLSLCNCGIFVSEFGNQRSDTNLALH